MSSIHDHFALVRKIAEWQTLEEAQALADDDAALEIKQEYKHALEDDMAGLILAARALVKDHPYDYVDFSGAAIREHFEEHERPDALEGMSDQDLQDAGEWALNSDSLWDSVYYAWEYGIDQVRSEKQKEARP